MSEEINTSSPGFRANAVDADGDGMVQDGTPFERPVEPTKDATVVVDNAPSEEPVVVAEPVVEEPVIVESVVEEPELKALAPIENGVIGSTTKKKPAQKTEKAAKPATSKDEKAAIHSTKNVSWQGVGKVTKGYNFVSKKDADKWVTRDHIRIVEPSEIAQELK